MKRSNKKENFYQEVIDAASDRIKRQEEYWDSEDFHKDAKIISYYLETNDYLDNETLLYSDETKYPISERKFCFFMTCLLEKYGMEHYHSEDIPFENFVFEWNGIIFRILFGQGTALQAWNKKSYEKKIGMIYQDICDLWNEQLKKETK